MDLNFEKMAKGVAAEQAERDKRFADALAEWEKDLREERQQLGKLMENFAKQYSK